MWSAIQAYMDEQLAELPKLKATPVEPFEFGSDLSCGEDVTADWAELPKNSNLLVVQSIYRRLNTERGSLPDDPDYGFDLCGKLNKGMTQKGLLSIAGQVKAEILKDDRIEAVDVAVDFNNMMLTVQIKGMTRVGAFEMTMDVDSAKATLLTEGNTI